MTLLALSWPVGVVSSVAIVIRDDRQTERDLRLRRPQN